jgi:LPS sulfotransferase NodH
VKPTLSRLVLDATRTPARYLLGLAGPRAGTPRRFLVLASARTGSELLASLLNAHPDVVCDSEILAEEVLWPRRLVEGGAVRARLKGARAYGFKLQLNQLRDEQRLGDPHAYLAGLAERGQRIYRLRRRNLLRQVLSFARMRQTVTHIPAGHAHPFPDPLTLDPAQVVEGLSYIDGLERFAEAMLASVPHMSLVYEDDLAELSAQQRTLDAIFDDLGVTRMGARPVLGRTSPARMREDLANFDEVAEVVGRTRFARFLE